MTAWPAAQLGAGLFPWVASIWADGSTRYGLWALGILLDVVFSVVNSRRPERFLAEMRGQAHRLAEREERRVRAGRPARPLPRPAAAVLDPAHLEERLGLFVIIVLGEAVMQVVVSASGHSWGPELAVAAAAGFGLIVALWWLTFQYGLTTVPGAAERGLPPYVALPAHFAMTAGVTATAAGLGVVAAQPAQSLHHGAGWVLGGGLALYFAASAVLGVALRAGWRWIWGWAVPTALAPLGVAALSGLVPGYVSVTLLLAVALWRLVYRPGRTGSEHSGRVRSAGDVLPA